MRLHRALILTAVLAAVAPASAEAALFPAPLASAPAPETLSRVVVAPGGTHIYGLAHGGGVAIYARDAAGRPAPAGAVVVPGARGFALAPGRAGPVRRRAGRRGGRRAHALLGGGGRGATHVGCYGLPAQCGPSGFSEYDWPMDVVVSPDGRDVYVLGPGLSHYRRGADGRLTFVGKATGGRLGDARTVRPQPGRSQPLRRDGRHQPVPREPDLPLPAGPRDGHDDLRRVCRNRFQRRGADVRRPPAGRRVDGGSFVDRGQPGQPPRVHDGRDGEQQRVRGCHGGNALHSGRKWRPVVRRLRRQRTKRVPGAAGRHGVQGRGIDGGPSGRAGPVRGHEWLDRHGHDHALHTRGRRRAGLRQLHRGDAGAGMCIRPAHHERPRLQPGRQARLRRGMEQAARVLARAGEGAANGNAGGDRDAVRGRLRGPERADQPARGALTPFAGSTGRPLRTDSQRTAAHRTRTGTAGSASTPRCATLPPDAPTTTGWS